MQRFLVIWPISGNWCSEFLLSRRSPFVFICYVFSLPTLNVFRMSMPKFNLCEINYAVVSCCIADPRTFMQWFLVVSAIPVCIYLLRCLPSKKVFQMIMPNFKFRECFGETFRVLFVDHFVNRFVNPFVVCVVNPSVSACVHIFVIWFVNPSVNAFVVSFVNPLGPPPPSLLSR